MVIEIQKIKKLLMVVETLDTIMLKLMGGEGKTKLFL